ncbi:MAG TPA: TetR-like C-terminal domain-containing protein [Mycobacteriales bacterium]|nr:TetR-like C-terminal domain-containing protein [Mycobacteriales bacterium]
MPAVKAHTARLASRLVDEAGRLLAAEGPAALTLRRLASVSGTSTMAVYTLFGDKQGLLAAMHREGFTRLGGALEAVAAGSLEGLGDLGMAYRDVALANPHLYALMFGGAVPNFAPDAEGEARAEAAYRPLVEAVQRCLDASLLVGPGAEPIAFHLWAVSHGMVSLELAGHVPGDAAAREASYRDALIYSVLPFLSPADGSRRAH